MMSGLKVGSLFITGASRGIGLEFVKQLTQLPQPPKHIFATCRNPDAAQVKCEHRYSDLSVKLDMHLYVNGRTGVGGSRMVQCVNCRRRIRHRCGNEALSAWVLSAVDVVLITLQTVIYFYWANLPNRSVCYAEGLWRMRRHGPVTGHCTNSEDFPRIVIKINNLHAPQKLMVCYSCGDVIAWLTYTQVLNFGRFFSFTDSPLMCLLPYTVYSTFKISTFNWIAVKMGQFAVGQYGQWP